MYQLVLWLDGMLCREPFSESLASCRCDWIICLASHWQSSWVFWALEPTCWLYQGRKRCRREQKVIGPHQLNNATSQAFWKDALKFPKSFSSGSWEGLTSRNQVSNPRKVTLIMLWTFLDQARIYCCTGLSHPGMSRKSLTWPVHGSWESKDLVVQLLFPVKRSQFTRKRKNSKTTMSNQRTETKEAIFVFKILN